MKRSVTTSGQIAGCWILHRASWYDEGTSTPPRPGAPHVAWWCCNQKRHGAGLLTLRWWLAASSALPINNWWSKRPVTEKSAFVCISLNARSFAPLAGVDIRTAVKPPRQWPLPTLNDVNQRWSNDSLSLSATRTTRKPAKISETPKMRHALPAKANALALSTVLHSPATARLKTRAFVSDKIGRLLGKSRCWWCSAIHRRARSAAHLSLLDRRQPRLRAFQRNVCSYTHAVLKYSSSISANWRDLSSLRQLKLFTTIAPILPQFGQMTAPVWLSRWQVMGACGLRCHAI